MLLPLLHPLKKWSLRQSRGGSIDELNERFREHGVGYQYSDGQIIRIDSELVHQEVVKPALQLLSQTFLRGAQQEFLNAHEHYRQGRSEEAITEALKAFESTMKSICAKRKWKVSEGATSKTLLEICFKNELVPAFWQSQMSGLRSLLEGGVPTGRNRMGGHGQGEEIREVPDYLVAYVLHMAASSIVFLAEADARRP